MSTSELTCSVSNPLERRRNVSFETDESERKPPLRGNVFRWRRQRNLLPVEIRKTYALVQ